MGTEKEPSLKDILVFPDIFTFSGDAIKYTLERRDKARIFNGYLPMSGLEKVIYVASNISPQWLVEQIQILSSVNYGHYVLGCVFPRYENPDDYHSTEFEVRLDEHPVQVLGWQEYEELIQGGVEDGLLENWIEAGFDERAVERGIDLEWHFFESPPIPDDQSSPDGDIILPLLGEGDFSI